MDLLLVTQGYYEKCFLPMAPFRNTKELNGTVKLKLTSLRSKDNKNFTSSNSTAISEDDKQHNKSCQKPSVIRSFLLIFSELKVNFIFRLCNHVMLCMTY